MWISEVSVHRNIYINVKRKECSMSLEDLAQTSVRFCAFFLKPLLLPYIVVCAWM